METRQPTEQQVDDLNAQVLALAQSGQLEQAYKLAVKTCRLARQHLEPGTWSLFGAINNLAFLESRTERIFDAERHFLEALAVLERIEGHDTSQSAEILSELSGMMHHIGDWTAEAGYAQRLLEIRRRTLGETNEATLKALADTANAYSDAGDYAAAEHLYQRQAELTRPMGEGRYSTALNNLASLAQRTGRADEAERLYIEALQLKRSALSAGHDSIAVSLSNLAVLYIEQRRFAEAEPLLVEVLAIRERTRGKDSPKYADTLINLASLHLERGDEAVAVPLFQEAVTVYEANLPGTRLPLLNAKLLWGKAVMLDSDVRRAEGILREGVEEARRWLPDGHPLVVTGLMMLGALYTAISDYDNVEQALLVLLPALTRRDEPGEAVRAHLQELAQLADMTLDDRQRASRLFDLGEEFYDRGHYAVALATYEEALARLAEGDRLYPVVLFSVGDMFGELGRYDEAETWSRRALSAFDRAEGATAAIVEAHARCAKRLGQWLGELGRHDEALVACRYALEIYRRISDRQDGLAMEMQQNIAVQLYKAGNYSAAKDLVDRLEHDIPARYGMVSEPFLSLLNITSSISISLGDFALALSTSQRALQIADKLYSPRDERLAVMVNNLGTMFHRSGRLDEARALLERAVALWGVSRGERHPDYADGLNNLSNVCHALGDLDAAVQLSRQVLGIRLGTFGVRHPATAQAMNNLGTLYMAFGQFDAAESMLKRAATIRREVLGDIHPLRAVSLHNLATLYARRDDYARSLEMLEEESAVHRAQFAQLCSFTAERHRLQYLSTLEENLASLLRIVALIAKHTPHLVPRAFDLVLQRKGLTLEALAAQRAELLSGRYPDAAQEIERLSALRRRRAMKLLNHEDREDGAVLREELERLQVEQEQLEGLLARRVPELNIAAELRRADRSSIAVHLPASSALIEFVAVPGEQDLTVEQYLAFVLPADDPNGVQMIPLGRGAEIEAKIAAWRSAVTGRYEAILADEAQPLAPTDDLRATLRELGEEPDVRSEPANDITAEGVALRQAVFDPLLPALGGRKRLVLAPDAALARVSFVALPLNEQRWLLEAYDISYVSVGRDVLRWGQPRRRTPGSPLVMADPAFDDGGEAIDGFAHGRPFTPLGSVRAEGQEVARLVHTTPFSGPACHTAVLRQAVSPVILHVASHGFFLLDARPATPAHNLAPIEPTRSDRLSRLARLENPLLRSGLAFAGANAWVQGTSETDEGILTAEDVTALDLLDTELVVLSACETGLGQVRAGEGVFGLRRAFALAGADTLVMSLWKVADAATRDLMIEVYRRILKGEPRSLALCSAQQALLAAGRGPRYWGAFICEGDPGPLRAFGSGPGV